MTPPGLFRRVRMNEAAVLSVPNTTHFDAKSEPDCIREAVSQPDLIGSCEAPTALNEDCEENNVDFVAERRPDQIAEVNSLWNVNSFLYDANDARLSKELHEETIVNPENYDLCTALIGDKKPVSADRANVMARLDTFFKRNLVVGYEAPEALWPHSRPTPESLANAGFYFAPDVSRSSIRDRVVCFHCGAEAFAWNESDDPLVKHVQIKPRCPFLLRCCGREWAMIQWSISQAAFSLPYEMFKASMSVIIFGLYFHSAELWHFEIILLWRYILFAANPAQQQGIYLEPRHARARRDVEPVRYFVYELFIPSEMIEYLMEKQLSVNKSSRL